MGAQDDPGHDRVTDLTRKFEMEDEQVFSGAGRGPTHEEKEAAERHAAVTETTRQAYKEMVYRGARASSGRDGSPAEQSGQASRARAVDTGCLRAHADGPRSIGDRRTCPRDGTSPRPCNSV